MLETLLIIPSSTSQKITHYFYFIYVRIITCYSFNLLFYFVGTSNIYILTVYNY